MQFSFVSFLKVRWWRWFISQYYPLYRTFLHKLSVSKLMMNTENYQYFSHKIVDQNSAWSVQINNILSQERYCIFIREDLTKTSFPEYHWRLRQFKSPLLNPLRPPPNENSNSLYGLPLPLMYQLTVYCWPRLPSPQPTGISSRWRWGLPSAGEEEGPAILSHSDSEGLPDFDMPWGSLGPTQPEHLRSCNGDEKVSSEDNHKFANKIFFLKISFLASHVFGQITNYPTLLWKYLCRSATGLPFDSESSLAEHQAPLLVVGKLPRETTVEQILILNPNYFRNLTARIFLPDRNWNNLQPHFVGKTFKWKL